MPTRGLGAIAEGLIQGMQLGTQQNQAESLMSLRKMMAERQQRQEQLRLLGETMDRIKKDPEGMETALSDPSYASQLGLDQRGYLSLMNTAKQEAEGARQERAVMGHFAGNTLTPDILKQYPLGVTRQSATNKALADAIEKLHDQGAASFINEEAMRIANPDERRRALPGIAGRYAGPGGPGRAGMLLKDLHNVYGGPVTSIEDRQRTLQKAEFIMGLRSRGLLNDDQARQELGLVNIDQNTLSMLNPQMAAEIARLNAAAQASGTIQGQTDTLSEPTPGTAYPVESGTPFSLMGGAGPGRTRGDVLAEQEGKKAAEIAGGQYRGPLLNFDRQNPTEPGESFGATQARKERALAGARETPALRGEREARAKLDIARTALAEYQADDRNIDKAAKLLQSLGNAATAKLMLRTLSPQDQKMFEGWYKKAQDLINASGTGLRRAPAGGIVPRIQYQRDQSGNYVPVR